MTKQTHRERLAKQREWRVKNKARVKAYSCSYHRLHAEDARVYFRKWSATQSKRRLANGKAYYLANRIDILEKARLRYTSNRAAILIKRRDAYMRSKEAK